MNRYRRALPGIVLSASLVACAVKGGAGGEDSSSSSNAISASPGLLRACSAAATYAADGPNDLDTPATDKLPAVLRKDADILHFKAPVVGDVYASGGTATDGDTFLYDSNGKELAHGGSDGNDILWFDSNDVALDCSSTPYNVKTVSSSSSSSSSGGWSSSSSSGSVDVDGGTDDEDASTGDDDDGFDGGVAVDAGH